MTEMRNTRKISAVQPEEMNYFKDRDVYGRITQWSLMISDVQMCALDPLALG
jgi:hypothetical protein